MSKPQKGDEAILELARKRFKIGQTALHDQLQRELDDLNFEFEPWTAEAISQRSGGTVGNIVLPPRPMLKIPTLDQPLQLVENQEKAAHLEPQIHPEGEDANDKTAEVLQSLYRDIETKSRASIARDWAFRRKIRCGRGWWRVNKVWANETDEGPGVFDQKLTIDRILNQASVTPDPYAQQPDWSDGKWAFVGGFKPVSEINDRYDETISDSSETYAGLGDDVPLWFNSEQGIASCRVTEYFTIETTTRMFVKYKGPDGAEQLGYEDEIGDLPKGAILVRRPKETSKVLWYKLVWDRILEREEWDGPDIPLIPDVGRESNINGKRRWEGIISKAKDAARLVNWTATTAVEKMAMGNISPLIMYEGQQEGHEAELAQANIRLFPYLLVKPVLGPNGELLPPPARNLQGPDLSSDILLMQQAKEFVSTATFVYDPGKGQPDSHRSGKAVQALQNQMDEGNSNYLDDHANIAVTREAQIVLGLIPFVYDRPGRLVQILGKDDEISQIILNQPYTMGEDGKPQAIPEGQQQPKEALYYDLKKGRYAVTVSVGKSFQTRRQQGASELGQLITAIPQTFPILGWRYVGNLDFPGSKEASNDLKKLIPPELKDENQPDPQALQAQMGQMQQQMALMQHVVTQQQQVIETKQVEQQGKESIAKMQASAQLEKTRMDNETKLAVAELGAKMDRIALFMEERARVGMQQHELATGAAQAGHEATLAESQRNADAEQADAQRQHEVGQAAAGAGQDADMAERGHAQALEQGEQGHGQAMEQAEQAAKLAPKPTKGNA